MYVQPVYVICLILFVIDTLIKGIIKVVNAGRVGSPTGKPNQITGSAKVVDKNFPGELNVKFPVGPQSDKPNCKLEFEATHSFRSFFKSLPLKVRKHSVKYLWWKLYTLVILSFEDFSSFTLSHTFLFSLDFSRGFLKFWKSEIFVRMLLRAHGAVCKQSSFNSHQSDNLWFQFIAITRLQCTLKPKEVYMINIQGLSTFIAVRLSKKFWLLLEAII